MLRKIRTAYKLFVSNKNSFFAGLLKNFCFLMPDKLYLKLMFRFKMGHKLDFENPRSFCEKLQWLKLYNREPLYTTLVDKCDVKKWVAEKLGDDHIIPTLGVWNRTDEIDFESLPSQFVLKTTNGSGGSDVIICKDFARFNKRDSVKRLNKSLKKRVYNDLREWPYKNIKPRIIAEKYLEDESGELRDFKFFCFNGVPLYCQVIRNRYTKETIDFYDMAWNHMPFVGLNPVVRNGPNPVLKPGCLNEMINACKILSQGIPFVRVDFYVIKEQFFFGEMTFYPKSGLGVFNPDEWNYKLGEYLQLPAKRNI